MRNGARNKSRRNYRVHPHHQASTHDNKMAKTIAEIAAFEEFKGTILPDLQRDLKKGLSPAQIREKYMALLQARIISDALRTEDPTKALAVAKDLLDRVEGRATEKKEVTHKFKDMKDEELDAIIKSEIEELDDMEQRFDQ